MKLIFGQALDKIAVEILIVFNDICLHECLIGGWGVLEVMPDIDGINRYRMKFGMQIEVDVLNDYPKIGCEQ